MSEVLDRGGLAKLIPKREGRRKPPQITESKLTKHTRMCWQQISPVNDMALRPGFATLQANQVVEFGGSIANGNHAGRERPICFRVNLTTGQDDCDIDIDASYTDSGNWLSSWK